MKKMFLCITAIMFVAAGFGQTAWARTKIDDRVSVEMPGTPEKKEAQGMIAFISKTADSTAYGVNVIDFANFGMDSAMLQSMVGQEMFLEQFKMGMVQQIPGSEVKEAKITTFGSFTAYDMIVEFEKEGKKIVTHSFNLFIGSKDYSFTIGGIAGVDISAVKEKFIKSIQAK